MERGGIYWRIVEREGGRCFICGSVGDDVHEVVPRSAFGVASMAVCMSERNRVLLCRKCHSDVHTFAWRVKLLGMLADRYGYEYPERIFQRYLDDEEQDSHHGRSG